MFLRLIIMSTLFYDRLGSKTEFCADQYSDGDMSDALGAGADHAMEGSTIRSREGSRLLSTKTKPAHPSKIQFLIRSISIPFP